MYHLYKSLSTNRMDCFLWVFTPYTLTWNNFPLHALYLHHLGLWSVRSDLYVAWVEPSVWLRMAHLSSWLILRAAILLSCSLVPEPVFFPDLITIRLSTSSWCSPEGIVAYWNRRLWKIWRMTQSLNTCYKWAKQGRQHGSLLLQLLEVPALQTWDCPIAWQLDVSKFQCSSVQWGRHCWFDRARHGSGTWSNFWIWRSFSCLWR